MYNALLPDSWLSPSCPLSFPKRVQTRRRSSCRYAPTSTTIFLACAGATFATRTVSTPFAYDA